MNKHTRNTVLYSFLTVSLVVSYWVVRQDSERLDNYSVASEVIEINEQASEGYELNTRSSAIVAGHYSQ